MPFSKIITTKTIIDSFTRKYAAIIGVKIFVLQGLFKFRPVLIGTPINILGAFFKFFYTLHTIPCIGFEASYGFKSIYFSGDTFYHPEKYLTMDLTNYLD